MNKPHFGTYRGWSEKDNKWVYGSLEYADPTNPPIIIQAQDIIPCGAFYFNPKTREESEESEESESLDWGYELIEEPIKVMSNFVHPESLGMFIVLYDTEDKPIYGNIPLPDGSMSRGGDIVVTDMDEKYIIEFRYHEFHKCSLVGRIIGYDSLISYMDEPKIIGNAYENPELLEENQ